jgi:hypothetical protein
MKNILWKKLDGTLALTSANDSIEDMEAHAVELKASGNIPADWIVAAVNVTIPVPKEGVTLDDYRYVNNEFVIYLDSVKATRTKMIQTSFDTAMETSHFMSTALGIEIDCRRSNTKNDLQNIQSLISKMERESWTSVEYVGYTETKVATKANLEAMVIEMEDFGLGLYQHKWTLWNTIQAATTLAQVEAVVW